VILREIRSVNPPLTEVWWARRGAPDRRLCRSGRLAASRRGCARIAFTDQGDIRSDRDAVW